jgi:hypothetical protein
MGLEKTLGFIALIWLVGSVLLMARSVREGCDLADELAKRHPEVYEALGRPRPGFFYSAERTRFAQYVGRRKFENLGDDTLSARFEAYRKREARIIVSVLSIGAILAALAFTMKLIFRG